MKGYLFDTSALLAHYRNEPGAERVQEILGDDGIDVLISALSIAEFERRLVSLGADASASRATALEYAGLATKVVAIDAAVSIRAFELGEACMTRLPLADALIASCAALSDAVLLHRDAHFDTIPADLVLRESL